VLAYLPESNSRDRINSHVKLSSLDNTVTHLNHRPFLLVTNLAFPANADNDMFRFHDRHEINFEFEDIVHFLNELFPIFEGEVGRFGDVDLLKVIFLFETGRVYGVCSHVVYR